MNYKKKTLLLIGIATVIRCITASYIELGNDEVYYRMYAQYLQWNYFDHPPMVGWLIRVTTVNLLFDQALLIRFGAIASAAATSWLLFLCAAKLNNAYTGFLAAVLYTATIYGSVIAGSFILPDSPQMVCWSAGLYLLIHIARYSNINRTKKRSILLFGIVAGIGMLCKIHTVFLWLGLLLYIILYNRQWLRQPVLYLSGFFTLLIFYPVIKWNIDNHFVTYLFHSKRIDVAGSGFDISGFLSFAAGQVLYCNPFIFVLVIVSTITAFKNKLPLLSSQKTMLLLCSLPLILIATAISLFKNVLPHWTGPAYSGLLLLTACHISTKKTKTVLEKKIMPGVLLAACLLQIVVVISGILMINFLPGTFGKKDRLLTGDGDFTLDMYGWRKCRKEFEKIVRADLQNGTMKKEAVIISYKWFPAAHTDYYIAMPLKKDLLAIGNINDIHQYKWINSERKKLRPGDDAYCIVPSNYYINAKELFSQYFTTVLSPEIMEQDRNGNPCRLFYIWRMKSFIEKQNPRTQ